MVKDFKCQGKKQQIKEEIKTVHYAIKKGGGTI